MTLLLSGASLPALGGLEGSLLCHSPSRLVAPPSAFIFQTKLPEMSHFSLQAISLKPLIIPSVLLLLPLVLPTTIPSTSPDPWFKDLWMVGEIKRKILLVPDLPQSNFLPFIGDFYCFWKTFCQKDWCCIHILKRRLYYFVLPLVSYLSQWNFHLRLPGAANTDS